MRAGAIEPWTSLSPSLTARARQQSEESIGIPPQWLPVLLASSVVPSPPPPPAPPCTVEMLRQRTAGDKSWPIACAGITLGTTDEELDLGGAHLSYGDFQDATFIGASAIRLKGAGLASADLSGSTLRADGVYGDSVIDLALAAAAALAPPAAAAPAAAALALAAAAALALAAAAAAAAAV